MPHFSLLYPLLRPAIRNGDEVVLEHAQRLAEVLVGDQRAAIEELLVLNGAVKSLQSARRLAEEEASAATPAPTRQRKGYRLRRNGTNLA